MPDDFDLLWERIRALLDASAEGVTLPRSQVEPILTDGYAQALKLDAKCLRLERRIDRLTLEVADGREAAAEKLSSLLDNLHETEKQSVDLRALLTPLRELVAQAA